MRDLRRHYEEKYKQRCRRIARRRQIPGADESWIDARYIGRFAHSRQACSCFMCGNPRRYDGEKTLRERRREQAD
jgi:hypothetical protein